MALAGWQTDPVLLLPILGLGATYLAGARRLHTPHRGTVRERRHAFFAAGYVALVVAVLSPLHELGEQRFSLHMVQHLLLTLVAAPLLLLSNAMPILLWALPARVRPGLGGLLGRPGLPRSVLRLATHPALAWWAFVLNQWLWHQPAPYELALQYRWAHYAEHVSFFATAVLFWWPVVGSAPLPSPFSLPARLLYTFLAWIPNSLLGAGLTLAPRVLYPWYAQEGVEHGFDALADQQLAGLVMWIPGDLLFLTILLALVWAYLQREERSAERLDRLLDAREVAPG